MKGLIRFALDQPVLVNVVFIGMVIFGAFIAVPKIPIDRYPNFQFDEVTINTSWPGASAEDVERLVTKRIEDAVRDMQSVEFVIGKSMAGLSQVFVNFVDDTDYDGLFDDMRMRVSNVQNLLPTVNGEPLTPELEQQETDTWVPVLLVALVSKDPDFPQTNRQLTLASDDLRNQLESIDGVKRIETFGNDPQQFLVSIDSGRLRQHGLTLNDVSTALSNAGNNLPAGILNTNQGEQHIRIDGIFRERNEVLDVVVRSDGDGRTIRVRDIINSSETGPTRIDGALKMSLDGRPTVALKVMKEGAANAGTISEAVRQVTAEFIEDPNYSAIDVRYAQDSSVRIADSISVLGMSLIQGLVLVAVVLLMFLTWRSAFLTASGILISFLGTILVFYLLGYSLNELSLLGFVLVVGIVVDDAIVVLENIQRQREQGKDLRTAIIDGTGEVFLPVVSATLTTCASFLPLLLMTGVVGQFFSLIPIAVVTALAISLVECLIVLPLHVAEADRLIGPEPLKHKHDNSDEDKVEHYTSRPGVAGKAARIIDRILRWNLANPWKAMLLVALPFLASIGILAQSVYGPRYGMPSLLKLKFFPDDASIANIFLVMPSGTTLDGTEKMVLDIAQFIEERDEDSVDAIIGYAGFTIDSTYKPAWSRQYGFLAVEFPAAGERSFDDPLAEIAALQADLKQKFEYDGVTVRVQPQQDGPPTGQPLTLRVAGIDNQRVEAAADALFNWLHEASQSGQPLEGLISLEHDNNRFHQVVGFEPDREQLARVGISESQVQGHLAAAFDGLYVAEFRRSDDDIPVRVRLARNHMDSPTAVMDVPVVERGDGSTLRFADLGNLTTTIEPALLKRRDYTRTISITGDFSEDSKLNTFVVNDTIDRWFKENRQDFPGISIAFGGEAEDTGKSYASLATAFGISVFFIYLILAVQFRSYIQPVIIMSNIIFSFTGVVLTLGFFGLAAHMMPDGWVREERAMFTVQSFIAIVALTGLVVNDAIVLVDFINRRIREGMDLIPALLIAGHQRVRPIMMTTISTIAGLLAMAIGIPRFSITWAPMATCFVAGVAMSTVLTLLIVPVIYLLIERLRRGFLGAPVTKDAVSASSTTTSRAMPALALSETT